MDSYALLLSFPFHFICFSTCFHHYFSCYFCFPHLIILFWGMFLFSCLVIFLANVFDDDGILTWIESLVTTYKSKDLLMVFEKPVSIEPLHSSPPTPHTPKPPTPVVIILNLRKWFGVSKWCVRNVHFYFALGHFSKFLSYISCFLQ